jgi:hypothetical protein
MRMIRDDYDPRRRRRLSVEEFLRRRFQLTSLQRYDEVDSEPTHLHDAAMFTGHLRYERIECAHVKYQFLLPLPKSAVPCLLPMGTMTGQSPVGIKGIMKGVVGS